MYQTVLLADILGAMLLDWLIFFAVSVFAYACINVFGHLTGGDHATVTSSVLSMFSPVPFLLIIVGNMLYAAALFEGFKLTPFALPIALCIGLITADVYSVLVLHDPFTWRNVVGVVFVAFGIYFLH